MAVEALAYEACPPLSLFEQGRDWLPVGKNLRQAYSCVMRQVVNANDDASPEVDSATLNTGFEAARAASEAFLDQWPTEKHPHVLLGAAAYLYAQGPQQGEPVRDALIWQLGRQRAGEGSGREPGIAHLMLAALRQIGLLGEPVWTNAGMVLYYQDAPCPRAAGVPVTINGAWYNLLRATCPDTPAQMSLVSPPQRAQAKARIADYVQEQFRGLLLTTSVTDNDRVITRTPLGNLFGYVQRDHELAAIRHDRWRIAWAAATDGNVLAILQPVPA